MKASFEEQLIFLHAEILLFLFLSFIGGVYTNQWSAGQAPSKPVSDLEVAGESWGQLRRWPLSLGMVLDTSGYPVAGTWAGMNTVVSLCEKGVIWAIIRTQIWHYRAILQARLIFCLCSMWFCKHIVTEGMFTLLILVCWWCWIEISEWPLLGKLAWVAEKFSHRKQSLEHAYLPCFL